VRPRVCAVLPATRRRPRRLTCARHSACADRALGRSRTTDRQASRKLQRLSPDQPCPSPHDGTARPPGPRQPAA